MFEIKVTVSCPDLVLAATALSKALIGRSTENEQPANPTPAASAVCPAGAAPMTAPKAPENPIPAAPIASPVPVAVPVQTPPQTAAAPVTAASTVPVTTAPAVPVTTAPQITIEQIGKAGADLITEKPESQAQLLALLQKYGVQSAHQLKPEQIGPFATEMRALGARI